MKTKRCLKQLTPQIKYCTSALYASENRKSQIMNQNDKRQDKDLTARQTIRIQQVTAYHRNRLQRLKPASSSNEMRDDVK